MKLIKFYLVLFLSLVLVGCGNAAINTNDGISSQVSHGVNMNDLGNILNGQYYFDDGSVKYYSTFDESGNAHIYMAKNGTTKSIFDGFGWSFALKDGWLYFSGNEGTKIDNTYNLFKMKADGSSYTKINYDFCFNMNFYKDWLYYVKKDSNDNYAVYRSLLDGTKETMIISDGTYASIVYEDNLYYISGDYLYKSEPDGTKAVKILNDVISQFIIGQGKIIYVDESNNIKSSYIDGTHIKTIKVSDGNAIQRINSYKTSIFYVEYDASYLSERRAYQYHIYSIGFDGTNDKKIYDGVSWGYYINIVDGKLYVLDYAQDLSINKFIAITSNMNLNGSNIKRLYRK